MFSYRAFGLHLRSDLELPELSPDASGAEPDIRIVLEKPSSPAAGSEASHHFSSGRQVLAYPSVGAFAINDLSEIVITPTAGVPAALLAFPLLGPVMGLLLHLRGSFVLHASAVSLNGAAVGFLGDKGAGKSTLAATLLKERTNALLSDDLLVFDESGRILPGFPQLKLAADALAQVKGLAATLRPLPLEDFPKHQLRLGVEAPESGAPAAALYEIHRDAQMRIEPLAPREALRALYRYSYISRFASRRLDEQEQRRLLQQVAQIVTRTGVRRLFVPDSLEHLPLVCEFLAAKHVGAGR